MAELSIIIPYVNEYPQIEFTIRNIAEELWGRVDFEIIAINNWCRALVEQGREEDGSATMIESKQKLWPWLKYFHYDKKLSHWQCKNYGVQHSTGKFLWFCDGHCIVARDALYKMFTFYKTNYKALNGTIHLPLTYHILESQRLIYKLVKDVDKGDIHYSFTPYRNRSNGRPFEVPCMSTCGMMMTRELFNEMGGWPEELGIYGGGENYVNFVLPVIGKKKWIMPGRPLCHHGAKRGYSWNWSDYTRNRLIAIYCAGGEEMALRFANSRRGSKRLMMQMYREILRMCYNRRKMIQSKQKISLEEWLEQWEGIEKVKEE